MIITIWKDFEGGLAHINTPVGDFKRGEVIECPFEIGEWLIHNKFAQVIRNWRWLGEKKAPILVPDRVIE